MTARTDCASGYRGGWAALLALGILPGVWAQETAHYPNGTSGLKAATLPPEGKYWIFYNYVYLADQFNDVHGNPQMPPGSFDVRTYANAHRFLFVKEDAWCDADFSWNFVTPFISNDVQIRNAGISDQSFTFGDLNVEPFVLEWHNPRWDYGILYGFFAPTGDRSPTRPSLPGRDYWTNYVGFGLTYYFDEERTWTASMLSRYEIHGPRKDVDLTSGDHFSFEWGLGKTFAQKVTAGVSGYCNWQTTDDRGTAVVTPGARDRSFAIGPEISMFFPQAHFGMTARTWWEFGVRDRTEGQIVTVAIFVPL